MKQTILALGILATILMVAQAQDIKPVITGPDTFRAPPQHAFIILDEIVGKNADGSAKTAHLEIRVDKIVYIAEVQPVATATYTTSTLTAGTTPTASTWDTTLSVPVNAYEVGNTEIWLDMNSPGDVRIVKGTPADIGALITIASGSKRFK